MPLDGYRRSFDPTISISRETRDFRDTPRENNLHSKRNDQTSVTSEKPLSIIVRSRGNGWPSRMQIVPKTIRVTRPTIDAREGWRRNRSITYVNFNQLQTPSELSAAREAATGVADTSAGTADRQRAVVPHGGGRLGGRCLGRK